MLKRLAATLLIVLTAVASLPVRVIAAQEALSDGQRLAYLSKPAVVRIVEGFEATFSIEKNNISVPVSIGGMGSGFIVDGDGFVLTNAHVVQLSHDGAEIGRKKLFEKFVATLAQQNGRTAESFLRDRALMQYIIDNTRITNFEHLHSVVLPNGDAFPFEIREYGAPVGQGKDVAIVKIEIQNAPTLRLGDSEKVQLQDHVTVVGYPGAADTFDSGMLDHKSIFEASITDGRISARKALQDGSPVLQISAPTTHGNSGGPVLSDSAEVIGLLTFRGDSVNGQEISGFSFAVPTSVVTEFVKRANVSNSPSVVDDRFREGIDLYSKGYYSAAIQKFDAVKGLFPQHSEVDALIADSHQKIAAGKERNDTKYYLAIGVGALILGLILALTLAIFIVRRSKKPAPIAAAIPPNTVSFPTVAEPIAYGHATPFGVPPPTPAFSPSPPGGGADKTVVVAKPPVPVVSSWGSLVCVAGPLLGQRFEVRPEGIYIGRDNAISQVVVNDNRVSKRHVWVGPRNGRIIAIDQGSTNGTFLNYPGSQRITEAYVNAGDTIIISEGDVVRFQYLT